ncbi:MAG TPA: hypothetical protein PKI62_15000 [bacterium]|nr:hypothetical protein [bacterium]HPR89474.1 hypothetical protein [bacterium]
MPTPRIGALVEGYDAGDTETAVAAARTPRTAELRLIQAGRVAAAAPDQ